MSTEIWKDVAGFKGFYQISNQGRVKSLARRGVRNTRIMSPAIHPEGYAIAKLSRDSKYKGYKVHRLVAKAFIDNPLNLPFVNHINGIKDDNRVENLEWCTNQQNIEHSYRSLGVTHKKVSYKKGKLKGVHFHKKTGKYCAKISWDGKEIHIGLFEDKAEAYRAYHQKHVEFHKFEPFKLEDIL